MRKAFINTLIQLAEQDKGLYLLTADMGFGLVEPFAEKFPKQYINVGVAEQNMIGVATGLALEGKKVFCYSIGNFPTLRCLEQIRNDVCYHNLPVCIVSGGAGLWYGSLGMTHWALEDIAVMRSLPNMAVVCPPNATEAEKFVKILYGRKQPAYLRMTRTGNGKANPTLSWSNFDASILATGGQVYENALTASERLISKNLRLQVCWANTLKPLSQSLVKIVSEDTKLVITIEEHSKIGGLGSAVAEVLAGMDKHPPLRIMGTQDCYPTTAMNYEELLKFHHLTAEDIVKEVLDALR